MNMVTDCTGNKDPIRIVQYGLGPIGLGCARLVLEKESTGRVKLVGAIDIDPFKVGKTVGELAGQSSSLVVSDDAEHTLETLKPDVVLHTTSSFLPVVKDQLIQCARAEACVVSSTEELPYPFDRYPEIAGEIDAVAREHGVAILGTGVNPGYAMDTLALAATGVCTSVRSVHVKRIVDAGKRRLPLQQKVGAGISESEFIERRSRGGFGHIGLVESLRLVLAGLNWKMDDVQESLEPVLAEKDVESAYIRVREGQVAGIKHTAHASLNGSVLVSLELQMYVGAECPVDRATVDGDPPINLTIDGGIFGDTATVGALFNSIPSVLTAPIGLRTVIDLPVPRCFVA